MFESGLQHVPPSEASPWPSQAASLALHACVALILALLVPPPFANGETSQDDVEWIRHLLASAGSRGDDDPSGGDDRGGAGALSTPRPVETAPPTTAEARGATPRRSGDPDVSRDRHAALHQAAEFGMIGLLSDPGRVVPNAPVPWAPSSADGAWGTTFGGAGGDVAGYGFGIDGLALSGTGEAGGGRGEGIGIGAIGTLGQGRGEAGEGFGVACGCGRGRLAAGHIPRAPSLRCGPPPDAPPTNAGAGGGYSAIVSGRLPAEAVQRVVRASFGRFRLCYEDGLRRDPGLQGRVSVKLVIDRQGSVATAADAGSTVRDDEVVSCVVRSFQALSFPEPEGGIVTVVYPLVLSPAS
jgi:hypothetical protein